jgi:hypothetical protein
VDEDGLGAVLVPDLALLDPVPEGVKVILLPGLGTRRVMARTRTPRLEARPKVRLVLDELSTVAEPSRTNDTLTGH